MRRGFGSSLKTRIAAVVALLSVAAIGLITLFVTSILHGEMQELVSKQQHTAATYMARDVDSKLQLRLESLKRVALNMPPALFTNPPAMQTWLEDRKAIHTLFPTGLMVIPPDGGPTIGDAPHLPTRPKSFVDRDWFIGAVTTRRPYISKPLITRATGQPALVVAIPVITEGGELLGVLAGVTPLATPGFLDLILGAHPGRHGSYQLVAPSYHLFALASELGDAITALPEKGNDLVIDQLLAGARGTRIIRNGNGQDELTTMIDIPTAGWVLVARQPTDEAFEPVWNTVRNTTLIAILLAFPIVVILFTALSRLLQPLSRLAEEIHDMAEGTRPMQPVATGSADEVADVANSFNRLQQQLLEQERRLADMAHRDTLTGLPNRLLINDRLDNELLRIARSGHGLALLFLDLDGFKPVNDQYGHRVGDLLLIEIAGRLRNCIREADTVARLGGDEFLILLSDTETPQEAAERVASDCIQALAQPIHIESYAITIGVSIGIAICNGEEAASISAGQLVSFADIAMYQAKADGRNRYVRYTPTRPQTHREDPIE
ncbi:MAG: sensor domain-containing diguanylate cyclase [Rhodocyclales bacterium GT-UBC]|nr:MAG: sensor domain-containing diguanylate cyclase [Rhodocyclales bacterium GT-UBC]